MNGETGPSDGKSGEKRGDGARWERCGLADATGELEERRESVEDVGGERKWGEDELDRPGQRGKEDHVCRDREDSLGRGAYGMDEECCSA